jgi:hypothetical protein
MSSSPAVSAEIPIPAERIIRELEKSAQPGFYGQVEVRLALSEDALRGVAIMVVRSQNIRSHSQPARVMVTEKETERELAVTKVVGAISHRLRLCLSTVKIVGHFADGVVNNCEVVDEQRVV